MLSYSRIPETVLLLPERSIGRWQEPARPEGPERHKETGGIVTVSVASLPGNLLVMLISAYKPFITADEQLIRLPAPWPAALMHSECLSITRRHERCPRGRWYSRAFSSPSPFFTLASFNGNLEARYGTISSLYTGTGGWK